MHFAAWLSVGDSVQDPTGYYRNNVGGDAVGARRDGGGAASSTSCSRRRARSSASRIDDADSRGSTRSADQRLRRDEAGDRARAAAFRARLRHRDRSRCATSTPPAPIRTASLARITRRRSMSSRARIDAAAGARHVPDLRRRLSDARWHVPARLRPRHRSGRRRTCSRSTRSRGGAPSTAYNLGNGRPTSVRDVLDSVERVTGRPVPSRVGAAPGRRSGGALRVERAHRARARLAARASRTSTSIVETAWRWHERAPARVSTRRSAR